MADKTKAAITAATKTGTANVHNPNDFCKVLDYFKYTVGTTLDCSFATGVLRNCITWYVRDMETMGLLQAIYVAKDKRTHFMAKHYSADPAKWIKSQDGVQLSLFEKGGLL